MKSFKNHWKQINLIILFQAITLIAFTQTKSITHIKTVSGQQLKTTVLDSRIQQLIDSIQIPGMSIAIINDAQVAYHKVYGVKEIHTEIPVDTETIFEAASLSKPVFAYFMMKMVEKGQLDLDKPIYPDLESIFPSGAIDSVSLDYYKMITPRMILSHSTGLPNWAKGKPIHIDFKPGTGFSYSGEAYQHLVAAFGTRLGIGWGEKMDSLFQQEVAQALKMENSFYVWNDMLEKHKAKGHQNGKVDPNYFKPKNMGPAHSLHSEALDYAHFLIEMMNPKHLSQKWIDEMLKTQNSFKKELPLRQETGQTGWGLGFAQKPTPNGLMHLHTGNNHDFQAYAMFVPEQQYGFVVFANSDNLFPFIQEIGKLIEEQF